MPGLRRLAARCASLTLAALLWSGCANDRGASPAASPDEAVAVVIDGVEISRKDYVDALMKAQGDGFLPRFAERYLVERKAKEAGITISDADVKAKVDAEQAQIIQGRYRGDEAAFAEQLTKYGLSVDDWRANISVRWRTRMLVDGLLKQGVDEARVRKLFEIRYGPGGVQRRISQILISTNPMSSRFFTKADYMTERPAIVADARRRAEALRAELSEGADFAERARALSDGPSASDGGDLGAMWSGRFGKAFDDVVGGLSVGAISPVIEAREGFHVAQVTGVRKGAVYTGSMIKISARPTGEADKRDEASRFTEAKARADKIKARLDEGADFAEIARAESADPISRAKGGDLGRFAPGRLGGEVDPVLETLPTGKASAPIKVEDGYLLVRLDARSFLPGQDKKLVRHIVLSTAFDKIKRRRLGEGLEAKAKSKAEGLLAKARGGEDFAKLAREHSEDELTRRSGGRMERLRIGALGPEVDRALGEMKEGEIRLVQGAKGFFVVRLDALVKNDFAAVRAALEREIRNRPVKPEDVDAYLAALREKASIEKKF